MGVTGLNLSRADFYEKELSFQVSCSYGPGRYDPEYEQQGHDYPAGFVRWTEQRNFEAVLDMMASGALDTGPLTTHRFPIDHAAGAYALLQGDQPYLGILLGYPEADGSRSLADRTVELAAPATVAPVQGAPSTPSVAFIGAGNYAGRVLMPAFKAAGARLAWVVASSGVGPAHYGKKFGFARSGTDSTAALADPSVNTVVIATRHDSHAELVCRALETGKHVFVEKPLALTARGAESDRRGLPGGYREGLGGPAHGGIQPAVRAADHQGAGLLREVDGPKAFVVTVNAGAVPADHWTQNRAAGGGRIVGEACHFVDLLRHLAGSPIAEAERRSLAGREDVSSLELRFEDGSIGTIHYLANGHKSFPKERIEVFAGGRVLRLDNFRSLRGVGWPGFRGHACGGRTRDSPAACVPSSRP